MAQLTGIQKPPSPFRRVDVPAPSKQQPVQAQQQQPRKSVPGVTSHFRPQYPSEQQSHFRPQLPSEQPFIPPTNTSWAPPSFPQNPPTDVGTRPGIGSITK